MCLPPSPLSDKLCGSGVGTPPAHIHFLSPSIEKHRGGQFRSAPPLGRVCSSWRALAHDTLRLWTSLHLVIPKALSPLMIPHQDATVECLERSKTLPISLNGEFFGHVGSWLYIRREAVIGAVSPVDTISQAMQGFGPAIAAGQHGCSVR
jgi:hypothetical protein